MSDEYKLLFSLSRLTRYGTGIDALYGYFTQVKKAESLYFGLHLIEVVLRNAIFEAYAKHGFSRDFFYQNDSTSYLSRHEFHSREHWKMLNGAKSHLRRRREPINDGKLIAELNFGFWTKLFDSRHQKYNYMWRKIFHDVFPHYPYPKEPVDQARRKLGSKLQDIKQLRNRVFHYEPIDSMDIEKIYQDMVQILAWISPETDKWLRLSSFDQQSWTKECIKKQIHMPHWRWNRVRLRDRCLYGNSLKKICKGLIPKILREQKYG